METKDIASHAFVFGYSQSRPYIFLAATKIQSLCDRNQANLKLKPIWPRRIFQARVGWGSRWVVSKRTGLGTTSTVLSPSVG